MGGKGAFAAATATSGREAVVVVPGEEAELGWWEGAASTTSGVEVEEALLAPGEEVEASVIPKRN